MDMRTCGSSLKISCGQKCRAVVRLFLLADIPAHSPNIGLHSREKTDVFSKNVHTCSFPRDACFLPAKLCFLEEGGALQRFPFFSQRLLIFAAGAFSEDGVHDSRCQNVYSRRTAFSSTARDLDDWEEKLEMFCFRALDAWEEKFENVLFFQEAGVVEKQTCFRKNVRRC